MRLRWLALVIVVACVGIIDFIGSRLLRNAPMEDRNRVRTSILGPEGTDFDFIDKITYDINSANAGFYS